MENNAFSSEPDYSINSATPVETAEEFVVALQRSLSEPGPSLIEARL